MHAARDATGRDEHEPLTALGELIRELHRDAAAERVSDHGRAFDVEHAQQVAHAVRVGCDRIVGAGLVGPTMPEEVGRDHRVITRELGDQVLPRIGAIADSVQAAVTQVFRGRIPPELHLAVEREVLRLERLIEALFKLESQRAIEATFHVECLEMRREVRIAGGIFEVRIDRIDSLQGGGFAILDYKSGMPGSLRWDDDRPRNPQLLAYLLAERGRDVHVLGYFFDSRASALLKFLEGQRQERIRRAREMAARLAQLGYRVDIESLIAALPAGASVGRPALADALVDAGHATGRRDAFDRLLGYGCPAFVPRTGPPLAAVVEKIRTAGGIASLAHPGLTAMDEDIPRFVAAGLSALEARHSDHCPDTEQWYRNLAAALGLVITGGSDFHADPAHHANVLGGVSLSAADFAALEFRAQTLGARVTH